jgi:hypothetical protein
MSAPTVDQYGNPIIYPTGYPLDYNWSWPVVTPSSSSPAPTPVNPTVSGIDPNTLAQATYGQSIIMFVGGHARIGGKIIFGPYITNGIGTWGTSFAVPANPDGTRAVYQIAFDSKIVWDIDAGYTTEPFTFRFKEGRLDQTIDALETARFPDTACAYRPQIVIFFENIPLAPYDNKIPYVAAVIGDTTDGADPFDGINLGTAIERALKSPWLGYTDDTFATSGIVDIIGGMLLSDQTWTGVDLVKNISQMFVNLDIIQNDKLRVVDRGALVAPDLVITPDNVLASAPLQWTRQVAAQTPKIEEFITIDPDADYTWVPAQARRPRHPFVISSAATKDSITLPIIMDASTRTAMAYYKLYMQDVARRAGTVSILPCGINLEAGDRLGLADFDGFDDEVVKITRVVHGANHVMQCELQTFMRCALSAGFVQHITCYNDNFTATTSKTFNAADLGTPNADRHIVLGIELRLPSTGGAITGVTIDGVTATEVIQKSNTTQGLIAALFHAAVPSDASGDVTVTASGNFTQASINIYRAVSSAFAVSDSASAEGATSSPISAAVDVPANGIIVAAGATRQGASFVWTNATQDCGFVNDAKTTGQRACALYRATDAEIGHAVSIDPSSIDLSALAVASFVI